MSSLHNRMQVILEKDAFTDWLEPDIDGKDLLGLLKPLEDGKLEAHLVDRRVGRVSEDDAGLIEAAEVTTSPSQD